ncbi:hypothetical protein Nepgr_033854 [Nepenthes gracilis]|uniref:Uncharacterized protein n=1 Tax=Nepenthes gracilis TaxID=150966 RepID=A0AAD3Y8P1_NEPGR|nr:hypothetical protein Nepgr_033854 [Nepenthes gracilis]
MLQCPFWMVWIPKSQGLVGDLVLELLIKLGSAGMLLAVVSRCGYHEVLGSSIDAVEDCNRCINWATFLNMEMGSAPWRSMDGSGSLSYDDTLVLMPDADAASFLLFALRIAFGESMCTATLSRCFRHLVSEAGRSASGLVGPPRAEFWIPEWAMDDELRSWQSSDLMHFRMHELDYARGLAWEFCARTFVIESYAPRQMYCWLVSLMLLPDLVGRSGKIQRLPANIHRPGSRLFGKPRKQHLGATHAAVHTVEESAPGDRRYTTRFTACYPETERPSNNEVNHIQPASPIVQMGASLECCYCKKWLMPLLMLGLLLFGLRGGGKLLISSLLIAVMDAVFG